MAGHSGDPGTSRLREPLPDGLRTRLGSILVRRGLLSPEQLETALTEAAGTGERLGEALVRRGWLGEEEIAKALAEQHGLRFIDPWAANLDPAAVELLSDEVCRRLCALPVRHVDERTVEVVVADPTDIDAVDELRAALGREVLLAVGERSAIEYAAGRAYGPKPRLPAPAAPEDPLALLGRLVGLVEELGVEIRRLRELPEPGLSA